MIEWLNNPTEEEKEEFIHDIPLELVSKAPFIEMMYGTCIILGLEDGSYELQYPDGDKFMRGYLNEEKEIIVEEIKE